MKVIQQEFDNYYGSVFGSRWSHLKKALFEKELKVQFNIHPTSASEPPTLSTKENLDISWLSRCQWAQPSNEIPRADNGLLSHYILDPASVLVARNLSVSPGEKVLDLCAAPGGKSLVLAQSLFCEPHSSSELILNELSSDRRDRLKKVIQQYIPRDQRDQIWVRGKDGTRIGLEIKDYYDAILLDAPCSGERHLFENSKALGDWSEKRTKGLALKQYSLLCSAWLSLKVGGRLMYSTCALSPLENDGVIGRFLKKKKESVQRGLIQFTGPGYENTEYGTLYMPDQCGFGPMYSCLLIKTSSL